MARNSLRFQGQQEDEETGLHYDRHRYYDSSIGRFTSQDPVGVAGGINLFRHTANPTQWIDPLGLTPCAGKAAFDTTIREAELGTIRLKCRVRLHLSILIK
ncbi:RHS repeat-associated core domain-containing protein [Burkholderia multivorans]|nr:RHS repeat-associated core domain-containing protein [Burkholderia multivorans]MCA8388268.1 RHS repeat-associated core domain-containing protein [Burkholderia multivorans]MDN7845371.1 RHS repeat-associated core domain-containing protein [Burkholderia multivorans]